MKFRLKSVLLICLFVVASQLTYAQHYFGARVGYGSGSVRLYPPKETGGVMGLYSGGFSWKYYSPERYVGGVGIDVEFMQKGYRDPRPGLYPTLPGDTTTSYYRYINSVQVPFMWQPHVYVLNRKVRIFMNFAITFSYNINSRYEWRSEVEGLLEKGDYEMKLVRDNRFGYGLAGGMGIGYLRNRYEFVAEVRYYYGYSDILKSRNYYKDNFYLRSPLDNLNFSMGIYYRLGKGGILAPMSKGSARKMAERETQTEINLNKDGN